jgi:hypothetical protein
MMPLLYIIVCHLPLLSFPYCYLLFIIQAMMKDQFANYVVQKVLETCDDQQRELILSRIKVHLSALKKYTYGKHIVARVEKLVAAGGILLPLLYLFSYMSFYIYVFMYVVLDTFLCIRIGLHACI